MVILEMRLGFFFIFSLFRSIINKIKSREKENIFIMNNKSIQFLRGTDANIKKSSETLLDGQPLYNKDKNTLSIGGGAMEML